MMKRDYPQSSINFIGITTSTTGPPQVMLRIKMTGSAAPVHALVIALFRSVSPDERL